MFICNFTELEQRKYISIIGGESTGKSTLAEMLANHYETNYVPEYARTYLNQNGPQYRYDDLWKIASGQLNLIQSTHTSKNHLLFLDTDLRVIQVWSEHAFCRCDKRILDAIARQQTYANILTYPDIAWEPDPLREHPNEEDRLYFFTQYLNYLSEENTPFLIVKGSLHDRLNSAIRFIDNLSSKIDQ